MPNYSVARYVHALSTNNVEHVTGFRSLALDNTEEVISAAGGLVPNFPPNAGEHITITSADVGALVLVGLNEQFERIQEVITVTVGATVSTNLFSRINSMTWLVETPITADVTASGANGIYRTITVGSNASQDAIFSVGHKSSWRVEDLIFSILRDGNQQTSAAFSFYVKFQGRPPVRAFSSSASLRGTSTIQIDNKIPELLPGPADLYVTAIGTVNNTDVLFRTTLYMEPNL